MREVHLRDLIAVVDSGSVRAAARHLGISQAAVSKNLAALEKSLGATLLVRTPHGVEPTEVGRIVMRRARVVETELRRLHEEVDELTGQRTGSVTIGLSATAESTLLAAAVKRFRKQHPDVLVSVLGGRSATTTAALREGRVDFAVGPAPSDPMPSDLHFERLFSSDLVIAARADHPLVGATELAALIGAEWIVALRQPAAQSTLVRCFQALSLPAPTIAAHCDSSSAMVTMLLGTDYLTLSSKAALEPFCRAGMLALVAVPGPFGPVIQHLITPATRPLTPSATALAAEFRKTSRRLRR
jgi:DNA-binding transcriptional LysR family regulator